LKGGIEHTCCTKQTPLRADIKTLPVFSTPGTPVPYPSNSINHPGMSRSFNGKIDGFKVELFRDEIGSVILHFDFFTGIPTDHISDISGNGYRGDLIDGSARAVTGHDWIQVKPTGEKPLTVTVLFTFMTMISMMHCGKLILSLRFPMT